MKKTKFPNLIIQSAQKGVAIQSVKHLAPDEVWMPSINMYEMSDAIKVCVDLAGVDKEQINVWVEPGELRISGMRPAPDPPSDLSCECNCGSVRTRTMEIDYGAFCRKIRIPQNVVIDSVESEYKLGLLWVKLPLKVTST